MRKTTCREALSISFAVAACFCVVLLSSLLASSQTGVPAADSRQASSLQTGPYYALIIGNQNYKHLPRLSTPINDANAVAKLLRDHYGFQTEVLLNADRGQILDALVKYRTTLPENANLLIYYAGHGHHDRDADEAYWDPVDARTDSNADWISADEITHDLKATAASHILIISDSCYAGYLVPSRSANAGINPVERNALLAKMLRSKSRNLMASGGDEPVADDGAPGHSIFAAALLSSLSQIDDNNFSAGDLFDRFVQPEVGGRTDQLPQYSWIRNSGHESGDFVFSRQSAVAPARQEARYTAAPLASPVPARASIATSAHKGAGSVHGHLTNTVGLPVTDGIVSLAGAGQNEIKYTFYSDANGDYKGTGIAPGTYTVMLREPNTPPDKVVDQLTEVKITAGADLHADFDLTRAEYVAKMTPGERNAAEETRAKNASALRDNSVIKNLNANLAKARQDNKDKNYAEADSLMSQATQAKPDAAVLWLELGVAQEGEKKYDEATTSLKKAIETNTASKVPNPQIEGGAQNELGRVYSSQSKVSDSQAAFEAAAKADPTKAAIYYTNEAIIMSQSGKTDETVAAADKAIAADATKPIPYYLKGQALVSKATLDPKTKKIVAPPGCVESYEKYLELAPDGPMAALVRQVLEGMGQTVKSSYKATK